VKHFTAAEPPVADASFMEEKGMSRMVLLLSVLVLAWPATSWSADDDVDGRATATELSESAETPDETGESPEIGSEETAELDELPVYVPPERGAPPVRVGGATRGGQLARHPL